MIFFQCKFFELFVIKNMDLNPDLKSGSRYTKCSDLDPDSGIPDPKYSLDSIKYSVCNSILFIWL
jgi:hypothetical protein